MRSSMRFREDGTNGMEGHKCSARFLKATLLSKDVAVDTHTFYSCNVYKAILVSYWWRQYSLQNKMSVFLRNKDPQN